MIATILAAFLAAKGAAPLPPVPAFTSIDLCAFSRLEAALGGLSGWRDLGPAAAGNPFLATELESILPGYRLAFVHEESLGLLLVGGARLADIPPAGEAGARYWDEAARETEAACAEEALSCVVETLGEGAGGLVASSRLTEEGEQYRRETLAFIGADRCSYQLQFTTPETALSEEGWSRLRATLDQLRHVMAQAAPFAE
ncbi:MAG: hypothetical protein ACE5ED_05105 [Rhodothalassiaceae bacterium]